MPRDRRPPRAPKRPALPGPAHAGGPALRNPPAGIVNLRGSVAMATQIRGHDTEMIRERREARPVQLRGKRHPVDQHERLRAARARALPHPRRPAAGQLHQPGTRHRCFPDHRSFSLSLRAGLRSRPGRPAAAGRYGQPESGVRDCRRRPAGHRGGYGRAPTGLTGGPDLAGLAAETLSQAIQATVTAGTGVSVRQHVGGESPARRCPAPRQEPTCSWQGAAGTTGSRTCRPARPASTACTIHPARGRHPPGDKCGGRTDWWCADGPPAGTGPRRVLRKAPDGLAGPRPRDPGCRRWRPGRHR